MNTYYINEKLYRRLYVQSNEDYLFGFWITHLPNDSPVVWYFIYDNNIGVSNTTLHMS